MDRLTRREDTRRVVIRTLPPARYLALGEKMNGSGLRIQAGCRRRGPTRLALHQGNRRLLQSLFAEVVRGTSRTAEQPVLRVIKSPSPRIRDAELCRPQQSFPRRRQTLLIIRKPPMPLQ